MPEKQNSGVAAPAARAGLTHEARAAIRAALDALIPIWGSIPPMDHQKVHRKTGPGAFQIQIEPYRGWRTLTALYGVPPVKRIVEVLSTELTQHQPELRGFCYYHGGMITISDTTGLALYWCSQVIARVERGAAQDVAIDALLEEINYLLLNRRINVDVMMPLYGLQLPDGVNDFKLSDDVSLVAISDELFAELTNADIELAPFTSVAPHNLNVAVQWRTSTPVRLERAHAEDAKFDTEIQGKAQEVLNIVLVALHVAASGQSAPVGTYFKYEKRPVPPLSGINGVHPLSTNPYASMQLEPGRLQDLQRTYKAVENARPNVQIAAARLHDAERRTSPVDALLDAVIGLEVLLNPRDDRELSFRVALNFAFLGPSKERHDRYKALKDIQSMRNKVVHGGINLHSKEAPLLVANAQTAKACLRSTLNTFLFNPVFAQGNLTADFWTNFVMPAE